MKKWTEEKGVIRFTVTSDLPAQAGGTNGEAWIDRLERQGVRVGEYAKSILRQKVFRPTSGVTVEVAILSGTLFEENVNRSGHHIRHRARMLGLGSPHLEVACLLREKFLPEDFHRMGFCSRVMVMHELVKDSDDNFGLLGLDTECTNYRPRLIGEPDAGVYENGEWSWWERRYGFVFVAS